MQAPPINPPKTSAQLTDGTFCGDGGSGAMRPSWLGLTGWGPVFLRPKGRCRQRTSWPHFGVAPFPVEPRTWFGPASTSNAASRSCPFNHLHTCPLISLRHFAVPLALPLKRSESLAYYVTRLAVDLFGSQPTNSLTRTSSTTIVFLDMAVAPNHV